MNSKLLNIVQSSMTIRELEDEFSKRWGWFKFKEKRECKKLKNNLIKVINSLKNDRWTIYYLKDLENIIIGYYLYLSPYMKDFYIQDIEIEKSSSTFRSMFFFEKEKGHVIILDIIGDNIEFTIFDDRNGETLKLSAGNETTERQAKVVAICKEKIIDMFLSYLNDNKVIDQEIRELSMKNFSSSYK